VDRLWPRGIKKEHLKYDVWEKDITPSPELRKWFHEDQAEHWEGFAAMYRKELENSEAALRFIDTIKHHHSKGRHRCDIRDTTIETHHHQSFMGRDCPSPRRPV